VARVAEDGTFRGVEALDRQILQLLAADGRTSYTDLGRATGLSTSAVHQRVRKLEERGVIQGYAARIDPVALGLPLTAFVSVTPLDAASPDDPTTKLDGLPSVEACYSVTGEASYLLKVRVASPGHLEDVLARIRQAAQVRTRSVVVLSTPWEDRPQVP
jgi:Lrp/AsnC family leucine-responsive transcriptional regulator